MTTNHKPGWQLADPSATYEDDDLHFQLNLLRPQQGLVDVVYHAYPLPGAALLRVCAQPSASPISETLVDSYVRGADLVATYVQTPERSFRPQIYWSVIRPVEKAVGIELTLSIQTSLLDSQPILSVQSSWVSMEMEEVLTRENDCWTSLRHGLVVLPEHPGITIFRPKGVDYSYVELAYPADFQGASYWQDDDECGLKYEFRLDFLEKGVIRKIRVQGLMVPRSEDDQAALAAHQRLAQSAPPLTT